MEYLDAIVITSKNCQDCSSLWPGLQQVTDIGNVCNFWQDSFSNPSTFHETAASVVERLITLAGKLGLPDSFSSGFSNSNTDLATRISFKVCSTTCCSDCSFIS
jgi:hypothetical protein